MFPRSNSPTKDADGKGMFIARPTYGGVIFLILSCAAGGVAVMNVGLMTALCASVLAGVCISSFIMAQFSFFGVKIRRLSAADVPGNSKAILPLRITNNSFFYRNSLVVKEHLAFSLKNWELTAVPPLAPGESLVINREVHADRRGHCKLEKVILISGDPCGFFRKSKVFHLPGEITITPRIEDLEHLPINTISRQADGSEGRVLGFAGIGGDFFGIRPFRYGDEVQHIYWRGSAARNRLMVKEFEASVTEKIHILLDCCRSHIGQDDVDNNFEHLVSAAASVAETASRRYCHLSFAAEFEDDSRIYISGDASGIHGKIIEALTEIGPCSREIGDLFCDGMEHIRPGETLFLLTMSSTPGMIRQISQLRDAGVTVNWLYAPGCNFPPIEPDTIRELPRQLEEKETCERITLDFNTSLAEVLYWNDDLEKI